MEEIVTVDNQGIMTGFKTKATIQPHENKAVELILVIIPENKTLILFNRGAGSSDMHNHWALQSGKVNRTDLADADRIGKKLSDTAFLNAAKREFIEELNFSISTNDLVAVEEFYMPSKRLYFRMFALPVAASRVHELTPDRSELDKVRQFTIDEFCRCDGLGDAILFRKDQIIQYLQNSFGTAS